MRRTTCVMVASSFLLSLGRTGWGDDTAQFYQEEAQVVSASLRPQPKNQSPATVYVVTQEDIKNSGARTIPEALRGVPGVNVSVARTGDVEVGIRGLNHPINNRVLVLVDGRSVQNGYFNNVVWDSFPVELQDIERIEIVEGPASALYGADAMNGVINIIMKTPEQMQGGQVTYKVGERATQLGSVSYGRKQDKVSYRMSGGWSSANRFEKADGLASEAGKFDGLVNYDFSDHSSLSLSGGVDNFDSQISLLSFGTMLDKGISDYLRADYKFRQTTMRAYWNRLRSVTDQNALLLSNGSASQINTDQIDLEMNQAVNLPFNNSAVIGGNYRKNTATSPLLNNGNTIGQDLWSFFAEDKWQIASQWMLWASGRVDRHPLTPIRFSPRGSLIYTPVADHVFRASAGTAFRNPTLLENYFTGVIQQGWPGQFPLTNPPFTTAVNHISGSNVLDPETVKEQEVSYDGHFGRLKTTVTGFHYTLDDAIAPGHTNGPFPPFVPPNVNFAASFSNFSNSQLRAWGSELAGEYVVTSWLRLFGNYSYEYLYESIVPENIAKETPVNQATAGFRTKNGGWSTQWMVNWVDSTDWNGVNVTIPAPVSAYFLLNAHIGYAFAGKLNGLELGVDSFNLLNHDHYEVSPSLANGEIVKSRFMGTASYKF